MQLSTYLEKTNVSATDFAKAIGVERQTVWRYLSGERVPRSAILRRIESATGGKVKPADFFATPERKVAS